MTVVATPADSRQGPFFNSIAPRKVVASYGGSDIIAKQIENGAPADIFISADIDWMKYLGRSGLIKRKTWLNFLGNKLVLISSVGSAPTLAIGPNFPLAQARWAMAGWLSPTQFTYVIGPAQHARPENVRIQEQSRSSTAVDTETSRCVMAGTGEDSPTLDAAVDAAVDACGGDARAAVRALIVANNYLEAEIKGLVEAVSSGFTRGFAARRKEQAVSPRLTDERCHDIESRFPHFVDLVPPEDGFPDAVDNQIVHFLEPLSGRYDLIVDLRHDNLIMRYCFGKQEDAAGVMVRGGSLAGRCASFDGRLLAPTHLCSQSPEEIYTFVSFCRGRRDGGRHIRWQDFPTVSDED